jgi:hypothetical protein
LPPLLICLLLRVYLEVVNNTVFVMLSLSNHDPKSEILNAF